MMKKILSGVSALTLAASLAAVSASAAYAKGDVDNSGKVDIEDAVMIISHINGLNSLSGAKLAAADVNGDGTVDIEDVVTEIGTVNGVAETSSEVYENKVFRLSYDSCWTVYSKADDIIILNCFETAHSADTYLGTVSVDYYPFTVHDFDDLMRYAKTSVESNFLNDTYSGEYKVTSEKKIKFNGFDAYRYQLVHTYSGEKTDDLELVFFNKGNFVITVQSNSTKEYTSAFKPKLKKVYDSIIIK